MLVLQADVLLDERDAGGGSIVWNGCGGHGQLWACSGARAKSGKEYYHRQFVRWRCFTFRCWRRERNQNFNFYELNPPKYPFLAQRTREKWGTEGFLVRLIENQKPTLSRRARQGWGSRSGSFVLTALE